MLKTAYVIDERYLAHRVPQGNPERAERMAVLLGLMKEYEREGLTRIEPRAATTEEILMNHDERHVREVAATAGMDSFRFDWDTSAVAATYETARLAAGGLLTVIDAVMEGRADNGIALVRPPGHHAEADRAMGFCFFNNVAIGAHYLRAAHGLDRVLVMDWDVHHGNGTQRSFYASSNVLYMSTHQYPFYPGTGAHDEFGVGDGVGYTLNVPLPAGCGDDEYIAVFNRLIEPVARAFDPQFVLVSAGFDHHVLDPLGGMEVTTRGMTAMARSLLRVARDHSRGRCAAVLEGGYSLDALTESVAGLLDEMGGEHLSGEPEAGSGVEDVIDRVAKTHREFWKL